MAKSPPPEGTKGQPSKRIPVCTFLVVALGLRIKARGLCWGGKICPFFWSGKSNQNCCCVGNPTHVLWKKTGGKNTGFMEKKNRNPTKPMFFAGKKQIKVCVKEKRKTNQTKVLRGDKNNNRFVWKKTKKTTKPMFFVKKTKIMPKQEFCVENRRKNNQTKVFFVLKKKENRSPCFTQPLLRPKQQGRTVAVEDVPEL